MSIIDKSAHGQGLQDIIDSYNKELMRLHSQSRESGAPEAAARPGNAAPAPADTDGSAAPEPAQLSASEREQWMKELEQGLEELRKGLIELAKGQKELSDGLREWQEGMSVPLPNAAPTYNVSPVYGGSLPEEGGTGISPAHMHGTVMPSEPPINAPIPDVLTHPTGHGDLCVTVNAARQAVPISGASVTVTLPVSGYELLYSFVSTDGSGRSPAIELPVYEDSLSEHIPPNADSANYTPEYRTYRVRVQAAGFRVRDDLTAEIFDGISSTLNVELEPLSGQPGAHDDADGGEGK